MNNDNEKTKKIPFRFEKIDTKEKAYSIGFISCDSSISNKMVEVSTSKKDKEVVDFISNVVDGNVFVDNTFDKKSRRFPRARLIKKIPDVETFVGSSLKKDRHFPIANKDLQRYVLLGAFDADGCITWGWRKDRNRIWQKISFTTSLKLATGIQQMLLKTLEISTIVKPKKNNKCFVLEFSNKNNVLKFLDYIYQDDFVVLNRKYLKAKALRLELEENGEGVKSDNPVPSLLSRKV